MWNAREAELVEAGPEGTTLGGVLHTRPLGEGTGWTGLAWLGQLCVCRDWVLPVMRGRHPEPTVAVSALTAGLYRVGGCWLQLP
jgi:hypothetical protein